MKRFQKILSNIPVVLVVGALLGGCSAMPENKAFTGNVAPWVMKEVMGRKDKIVHLSSEADSQQPVLLLLHGATDEPSEMMDIAAAWQGTYDVFLYSYNYHQRVEKVAARLTAEVEQLKSRNCRAENMTVVAYSYAAIVFRTAVVLSDDKEVFSGVSLVQLMPTAGGSYIARGMKNPLTAALVSLASKPSAASNPYGRFAEKIWEGEGNKKFYEIIKPARMHSILLEGDPHSLARIEDETSSTKIPKWNWFKRHCDPEIRGCLT